MFTEHAREGEGGNWTIHLIDMIFGKYNQFLFYFLLSAVTWSIIAFHGNFSNINDVTSEKKNMYFSYSIVFLFFFHWDFVKTAKTHQQI